MNPFKDGGIFEGGRLAALKYQGMLMETRLPEIDRTWWELRAYLIAEDKDRMGGDLPLLAGLSLRVN